MIRSAIIVIVVTITLHQKLIFGEEMYSTKWDNTDLTEILKSERLLGNYVKCLMDEGPCTADAKELKRVLKEALETDCAKCSEKQKQGAEKVIRFLIEQKPQIWAQLETKYDPDGIYRVKYVDRFSATPKP